MIRLRDALTLSVTKLKTRRVRLVVTTIVSGLFFVILALVSILFSGATKSIEDFANDGFGKRYIAQVGSYGNTADYAFADDKNLIAQAKEIDKKLIEEKKAEAKRLGLTYDPASEQLSVIPNGGQNGGDYLQETAQVSSIIQAYRAQGYKSFFNSLEKAKSEYSVKAVYNGILLSGSYTPMGSSSVPQLSYIKDNKEIKSDINSFGQRGFASIGTGLTALDSGVLDAFTLEGQSLEIGSDGFIPVVAPFSAAEEALGFKRLSSSAKSEEKLERLRDVRAKAAGATFQLCLRNTTSYDRQQQAEQQQVDYKQNKDKKGYVRPDLMYDVAAEPCKDVVVTRDVRTAATKANDEKQRQFDEKFGKKPAEQRLVTFRIVGVAADPPAFDNGFSVSSIVTSLMSSNLGNGWFVPLSARSALPEYESLFQTIGVYAGYQQQILFELEDKDTAKKFVKQLSCEPDFGIGSDVQAACDSKGTPFYITSFGSNSVAIEDVKQGFSTFFTRTSLIIAAISAIIMMGTIGKVIADSRRETAVFRAIGAKRTDIALVYILYALLLGVIVSVFALGVGGLLAVLVNNRYSSEITIDALTIFNSQNLEREFVLVGVNARQLIMLVGVILGAGLVSTIGPLLSNLKRNPIKDMRDER